MVFIDPVTAVAVNDFQTIDDMSVRRHTVRLYALRVLTVCVSRLLSS